MVREAGVLPIPKATVFFSVVAAGNDLLVGSFEVVAAVNDMAVVNPVTSPFLRVSRGSPTDRIGRTRPSKLLQRKMTLKEQIDKFTYLNTLI
jgi:hypothetical protein